VIRTLIIERWSHNRRWLPSDVDLWTKALLLTGVAIQGARLLWAIATPVGPLGEWMPSSARALPPQVQMAILAAVDPFVRGGALAAAPVAAELNVKLYGIRGDGGLGGGAAIIGLPDGTQQSFVVGEEVAPGVILAGVHFDYVLLDRGGQQQQKLFIEGTDAGVGAAVFPSTSAEAPLSAASTDGPSAAIIRQAVSFAPRNRGGKVNGVVISPGSDPALFASAGFRTGDVVVAVNGARIASAIDVAQLQSSIVPGARLLLTVERGAETVPVALNIAGN